MSGEEIGLPSGEEARVRAALKKIEQAQQLVRRAAEELSPVDGFAAEWSANAAVHDAVRDYWYRVERRLAELKGVPPSVP